MHDKDFGKQFFMSQYSSNIILEIELIDFVNKKKPMFDMTFQEKMKAAEEFKAKGNQLFKEKLFDRASNNYKEGLTYLETVIEEKYQSEMAGIMKSLQLNICVCLNSLSLWKESKTYSDKVLQRDLNNPKARYLRGIAEKNLLLFDEALEDFNVSFKQNPSDERIKFEIESVKELVKKMEAKEKKSLKNFFKTDLYSEKDPILIKVPKYNPTNPKVFMKISVGKAMYEIVIELFKAQVPKTVENFRCICTGEKSTGGNKLYYGGFKFYKLVKGLMIEGGDIENDDGTGEKSIYYDRFTAETTHIEHSEPGLLTTVANEPKGNDSKFCIMLAPAQEFNMTHTVFGRIIKGLELLEVISKLDIDEKGMPKEWVVIEKCGIFEDTIDPQPSL